MTGRIVGICVRCGIVEMNQGKYPTKTTMIVKKRRIVEMIVQLTGRPYHASAGKVTK